MPTRASRPAAVVWAMPWSWAAGMKCVWIRPLVDQPHTQKVRTSAQKAHDREDWRRTRIAASAGDSVVAGGASTAYPSATP